MKPKFRIDNPLILSGNDCHYTFTPLPDSDDPQKVSFVRIDRRWRVYAPDFPSDDMGVWKVEDAQKMWQTLADGGYEPI
jgi:hypothetical protein